MELAGGARDGGDCDAIRRRWEFEGFVGGERESEIAIIWRWIEEWMMGVFIQLDSSSSVVERNRHWSQKIEVTFL